MFLTLPRERNTAFPSALPFNLHPVGKRRSFLPTEGRIIPHFSPFSRANLPSNAVSRTIFLFLTQHSVLSPQSFFKGIPVAWYGKKNAKMRFYRKRSLGSGSRKQKGQV